ncbi:hypothetical protein A9G34_02295 [Gilliamella sp. Choc4-2]|jgi:hypothetical protein|uniref:hypothetical protein n=1 Tax=unclassified Gilliamella TaxID=2685620 RepID=UPI00080EA689|nr:hypothetical protein [Gilliamella apicola]OCG30250.1 hypothetical protein A9G33_07730 [Gilliamella apicola]OCG47190.1 hypothetical protein A9G34_02295 [Gilliamella apicola]OCG55323.1 hypothetical protein A9G36_05015 [Gilliamella apicola]
MQKKILSLLLIPCLSLISLNAMALSCGDNADQNTVEANNYIFQLFDYIDLPVKGIKQETTTTITKDENTNQTIANHTLDYDPNGLIIQSHYELYSDNNKQLYSEHLQKIDTGWENIIEDFEDKTNSITQFTTDTQGKIIQSHQVKKAVNFIFIQNDSYQYDSNNCLINKKVRWQLKETDINGQYTDKALKGNSVFTYNYQDQKLSKFVSQFGKDLKSESDFLYQYDNNHRLSAIQSFYSSSGKRSIHYATNFLTFNDKNDWLTASKVRKDQNNKQANIIRKVTYY